MMKSNPGQGANGNKPKAPGQLTRADLKTMTAAEIDEARRSGQLDHLMGRNGGNR